LLPEGVLNPSNCVLNQGQNRAKRGVSGEAPAALLPEGVLNPVNCVLNPYNAKTFKIKGP